MSFTRDCPKCLRKIRTAAKFCKYCGSPLKVCPKCTKINRVDDDFCAECGNDIKAVKVAESIIIKPAPEIQKPDVEIVREIIDGEKQQRLIVWPPTPTDRAYSQVRQPLNPYAPKMQPFGSQPQATKLYDPKGVMYLYSKVKALGFLGGPLPTSNVLSATLEAFGIALALIAAGVVIVGIGMAFYQYLVFPIIAGVIGGALLLSAPFFGIYYVSSNWLYRTFEIQRPVRIITIIWNYVLSTLIFSLVGLMLAPLFIIQDISFGILITFSIIGGIVYLMGLIIVPLKVYWADLIYVKAAMNARKEEEEDKKGDTTEVQEDKKGDTKEEETLQNKEKKKGK